MKKRVQQLLLMVLITGCVGACRPPGHPPMEELLIDLSVFPDGWSEDIDGPGPMAKAPLGGTKSVESIMLTFYTNEDGAIERIRRFNDSNGAAEEFARQMKLVFRETEFNTPWVIPTELTFESSSTAQFYYACSKWEGSPWLGCDYIAQYGVYFIHFDTGIYPDYMSYSDFENVLRAIDDKMAEYADK